MQEHWRIISYLILGAKSLLMKIKQLIYRAMHVIGQFLTNNFHALRVTFMWFQVLINILECQSNLAGRLRQPQNSCQCLLLYCKNNKQAPCFLFLVPHLNYLAFVLNNLNVMDCYIQIGRIVSIWIQVKPRMSDKPAKP